MHVIEKIKALQDAKTVRDILSVDLPHPVHKLENVDSFNAMAANKKLDTGISLSVRNGYITPENSTYAAPLDRRFSECFYAMLEAEEQNQLQYLGTLNPEFTMVANGWLSDYIRTGTDLHADDLIQPTSRVWLCSTKETTLFVPHHRMLEIMNQFPVSQVLDQNVTTNGMPNKSLIAKFSTLDSENTPGYALLKHETQDDRHAFVQALTDALEPSEEGVVYMASGFTFHKKRQREQPERVFFRGYAYDFMPQPEPNPFPWD